MPTYSMQDSGLPVAPDLQLAPRLPLETYHRLPHAAELLAEAQETVKLSACLLALPPLERHTAALGDPRFHRLSLAKLLALQAESELFSLAGDARPLAETAADVASALSRDSEGRADLAAARAYWLSGKAQLKASQWRPAEHAFSCMHVFIPRDRQSHEEALAAAGFAQLYADLGDLSRAIAHFLRAAYVFVQLLDPTAAAGCQAELGLTLLDAGDRANAATALRGALRLLDAGFAPSLAARVRLGLAEIEATLGNHPASAEHLRRARVLYPLSAVRGEPVERRWREARVTAAAGLPAEAEAAIDRVRLDLLAGGSLSEAKHATCEQILLRLAAPHAGPLGELTAAVAAAFPGPGAEWAAAIDEFLRLTTRSPQAHPKRVLAFPSRLRHVPDPSNPERPPLTVPTRMLADRLLCGHSELADPVGAASL